MSSPLPPDPYVALGVPKDATAAAIKTAHRKLVLKCHPDKVSDPTAKEAAADLFHKIQTAYEILVDQDRRERYDAQVRLAELRKEKLERQGAGGLRGYDQRSHASPYKSQENVPRSAYASWESGPTPQYEERRPSYAKDYFDAQPRASTRKEPEYERTSRRTAHDVPKPKVRTSARDGKDGERERRKEKTRKAERDTQRDRDRKYSTYVEEEVSESNSDEYERRSRKMREEDEVAAARKAREAYYEQASKQQREAKDGHFDERTRKMFAASADAWDYIRSSRGRSRPDSSEQRRPSPVRQGSSKDKFEYVKRKDGRPAVVSRKNSERPKTTESSRKTSTREAERRSSLENVEEARRPPTLNTSKSSPADIRIPTDKPRAQSVQVESGTMPDIPKVRRSETAPYDKFEQQYRSENVVPPRNATSRATEFNEGLATPATTPEYPNPSASAANSTKYRYGQQYADDAEYPTPDGYRTNDRYRIEVREPGSTARPSFTRKVTRSPSPVKETRDPRDVRDSRDSREKLPRTTSSRYPSSAQAPPSLNTRTTSYVYSPGAAGVEPRQNSSRGTTPRDQLYYGEIRQGGPPEENLRYQRPVRPEDIRVQSGYGYSSKRGSGDRPTVSRSGSGNPVYTSVRASG